MRSAIRDVDAAQPIAEIVPLRDTLLGIYGVVAYRVSLRLQEIGIRLALGADAGAVVRMITLQAATWWAPGLIAGLAGALSLAAGPAD